MTIRRIACCVDFSENAGAAFETSLELAAKFEAKLYVIHVLDRKSTRLNSSHT